MNWAVDALLQSIDNSVGDTQDANEPLTEVQLHKREALECLACVRDILNKGKVPKVLDEDRLIKKSEQKPQAESKAETRTKEPVEAAPEKDAHRRDATFPGTRASSAPLPSVVIPDHPSASITSPPLSPPPASTISRPTPYLSTRDSTPVSTLPRTPFVPPSYLSSSTPNGVRHSSAPITPWQSTPSAFSTANSPATIRKPAPISNSPNIPPSDARRTNQAQVDSFPIPTYQSDPLHG